MANRRDQNDSLDPLTQFRLDGKVAVVTGGSGGIGRQIAVTFAGAGAKVFAVARRSEQLAALASEHKDIEPWVSDLSDEEACEALIPGVAERTGQVDILVNNAGISNIVRAQEEATADFRHVLEVNLVATFILSREAGKLMIDRGEGGAIVNVASAAGIVGSGDLPQASYAASKAGSINMTRELAIQWARHGIRVNAVAPGWVDTDMTSEYLATERGQGAVKRLTPLRRAAVVEEIALAVLFLASPASSYITGAVLPVDGGWTAA